MRKLLFLLIVIISTSVYAQKDQLIGSWSAKVFMGPSIVETFFSNGTYRTDMFFYAGNYKVQVGTPQGLKWKVDEDGVLTTYGTPSATALFVKVTLIESSELSPAEKKTLREKIPELEKKLLAEYKKSCKTQKPSNFDFKFNEEGELQKKSATEVGGNWVAYKKTDLPWTPSVKKSPNTKKR